MTRMTSAQSERTRPSARVQRKIARETTPVLFRLPIVETIPFDPIDDEADSVPIASFGQATGTVGNDLARSESFSKQSTGRPQEQTPEFKHSPVDQATTETDGTLRSWWEHWSSGVVVIVLAIVLLTMSLVLLRSRKSSSDATMARGQSADEFGDLDSITVPIIAGAQGEPGVGPDFSSDDTNDDRLHASLVSELANTDVSSSTHGEDSSTVPTGAPTSDSELIELSLVPGGLAPQASAPSNSTPASGVQEDVAAANLHWPTPSGTGLPSELTLPTMTEPSTDYAAAADALPSQQRSSLGQPANPQLGQSPTLYDEATRNIVQGNLPTMGTDGQAVSSNDQPTLALPTLNQANLPANTGAVGAGTMPSPTSNSMPMASLVSGPNALPSSSTAGPGVGGFNAQVPNHDSAPTLRTTATPEPSDDEIIRAYLELVRSGLVNQGESATANNGQAIPNSPNGDTAPSAPAPINRYQNNR